MAFPPPSAYAHDPVPAPTTTTATTTATFTPASRNTSAQASAHATTVEDDVRVRRLREEVEDRVRMLRYSHRRNTERVVTAMARDTEEFKSWKDRTIESLQELYEEGRISYRLFLESTRELNRARVPGLFDTISHVIAKNNMYSTTLPTPLSRPPAGGGTQTSPPSTPAATTLTPPNSASTSTSGDYDDGRTTDVGSEEDYAHYDTGISSTDYEHLLSDSDDDSDSVELSFVGPVTVVDTPPVNDGTDSAPATARTNTPVFFGPPLPPKMAAARNAATTAAPPTGGIDPTLAALATVVQLQGQAPIFQGPAADYARIWEPLFNPPPMQPPVFPFRYNAMPEGVDFENMTDDDGNDHEHETEDEEPNDANTN